ncbi:uncharacterized protein LOC141673628 [Apium graveolens]|uniref:uncharacterized protein LOC141673628 n=1 Tax=Apium graveolens TaxID=4045 RepID=UPI003D7BB303
MAAKLETFQQKFIKGKMPITNILLTQRGLSSTSSTASLVFHGQDYDLSAYMNQQGGGDININISDKGVRIVSKKKRQYFHTASLAKMQQQQCVQTVPVAEAEVEQQPFQTDQPAEAEQQQNHFQNKQVTKKQQRLWTVPVAIAGVAIASFLYLRWK